jgi:hypothetical protein
VVDAPPLAPHGSPLPFTTPGSSSGRQRERAAQPQLATGHCPGRCFPCCPCPAQDSNLRPGLPSSRWHDASPQNRSSDSSQWVRAVDFYHPSTVPRRPSRDGNGQPSEHGAIGAAQAGYHWIFAELSGDPRTRRLRLQNRRGERPSPGGFDSRPPPPPGQQPRRRDLAAGGGCPRFRPRATQLRLASRHGGWWCGRPRCRARPGVPRCRGRRARSAGTSAPRAR